MRGPYSHILPLSLLRTVPKAASHLSIEYRL